MISSKLKIVSDKEHGLYVHTEPRTFGGRKDLIFSINKEYGSTDHISFELSHGQRQAIGKMLLDDNDLVVVCAPQDTVA